MKARNFILRLRAPLRGPAAEGLIGETSRPQYGKFLVAE